MAQKEEKQARLKSSFLKTALVAVVAGVLGGGLTIGAYNLYQNQAVSSSDDSQATTKVSNVKVNVSTQATKAFNKIKRAVVTVEAYQKSDNSIDSIFGFSSGSSEETTSESEGSGVIYKKNGNTAYVVTNNHVISGADSFYVMLYSGKRVKATVVGKDSVSDLAVLKIDAKNVEQTATFGNSDNIQVGETALAIGSPMGSEYATSLTQGIISAKKRTLDITNSSGVTTGSTTVIQTDAAINSGNSGGPLVNLDGQVIGINSMKLSSNSSSSENASVEGMGFAIPSNEVVKIINQLVTKGKVSRPALGISGIDLDYVSDSAKSDTLKLPDGVDSGVVVMKSDSDSPLKDVLSKYDVIVSLGGKKVTGISSLKTALYAHKVGDSVTIKYYHDGQLKSQKVTLSLEASESTTTATSSESEN
ncbi:S1C family serine protease [Ligilactobacillus agilis]|uniref:Serine protease n=1 Tax=Ligilactobacillus agilis TaxID=1601 RepID=A0A2I2ABQ0_9LACO|nr:trypsin-like peptidase domain-containing protein [Ligilactobacillus agilis]MBL1055162.1 trypsin-like peptidase domain-containing protein [Ligilactobacillus agilis]MDY4065395.1 trypsin-like peptidase domain-containing protein [Ligilactobacillus agilis]PLA76820.1 serine protease [Ligilactobacillus agilis]PLA83077.1 serine protease [Ligilactobacillus agilis]UXC63614.1 trypsin-like peptidase domain-containing protein [Ligilactobacillus agilis]